MPENDLYLAILPLIRVPTVPDTVRFWTARASVGHGTAEQVITLFPDKGFATVFYPDEVELYISTFRSYELSLMGGHVLGYDIFKEPTDDGRVIVRVVQRVG